jgi:hypothetical protein
MMPSTFRGLGLLPRLGPPACLLTAATIHATARVHRPIVAPAQDQRQLPPLAAPIPLPSCSSRVVHCRGAPNPSRTPLLLLVAGSVVLQGGRQQGFTAKGAGTQLTRGSIHVAAVRSVAGAVPGVAVVMHLQLVGQLGGAQPALLQRPPAGSPGQGGVSAAVRGIATVAGVAGILPAGVGRAHGEACMCALVCGCIGCGYAIGCQRTRLCCCFARAVLSLPLFAATRHTMSRLAQARLV